MNRKDINKMGLMYESVILNEALPRKISGGSAFERRRAERERLKALPTEGEPSDIYPTDEYDEFPQPSPEDITELPGEMQGATPQTARSLADKIVARREAGKLGRKFAEGPSDITQKAAQEYGQYVRRGAERGEKEQLRGVADYMQKTASSPLGEFEKQTAKFPGKYGGEFRRDLYLPYIGYFKNAFQAIANDDTISPEAKQDFKTGHAVQFAQTFMNDFIDQFDQDFPSGSVNMAEARFRDEYVKPLLKDFISELGVTSGDNDLTAGYISRALLQALEKTGDIKFEKTSGGSAEGSTKKGKESGESDPYADAWEDEEEHDEDEEGSEVYQYLKNMNRSRYNR